MNGEIDSPIFVAFEGLDGSGKSTVGRLVAERLGAEFLATPPENEMFNNVRREIKADLASHLFYAATVVDASDRIKKFLETGRSAVVVRYWASTLAYDTIVRKSGIKDDTMMHGILSGILAPHFTVCVKVPSEIRKKRMKKRKQKTQEGFDDTDQQSIRQYDKLEKRYDSLLEKYCAKAGEVIVTENIGCPESCAKKIVEHITAKAIIGGN